jgi:hypothetical protein
MYPYMNEDAAWQRVQDLQREIENSRLMAAGRPGAARELLRHLAARAWYLGRLAALRPARYARMRHDGE